ncbi:hypothetical protein [[Micrococcus luteus] ATCC 49442]|uniref:hypothetical protein n=1 Tax=[Micrococcus luteus] ATCC 49442 TaxID=2698727 RepID=UPI0013DC5A84|nr:hypothetical protein [[Micrococcus luteus] ATCC 49442]
MSTIAHTHLPHGARQPRGEQPWCLACDTDLHLVVDSITVADHPRGTLNVAFHCTKCKGCRVLSTTARLVAAVLARATPGDDVVHIGAQYIHCGEPMSLLDPDLWSSRTHASTDPRPGDYLGAYLRTRVLRCHCGFQMEAPRTSPSTQATPAQSKRKTDP